MPTTNWLEEDIITERLGIATDVLREHNSANPIQPDLFVHSENVSVWLTMTTAYSLIEQALKAVLRRRQNPAANIRRHDIYSLFNELPQQDQSIVEREFWVYPNMPWKSVHDFLYSVANDYSRWRYLLIEVPNETLSKTNPEILLAILQGILQIFKLIDGDSLSETINHDTSREQSSISIKSQSNPNNKKKNTIKKQWLTQTYIVHGLRAAGDGIKGLLGESEPLRFSIEPNDSVLARSWMAITCGYSLLEQTIKALLHYRGNPEAESSGRSGHLINNLYQALPDYDRNVIERGFKAYISLFDEIPESSAANFVDRIGHDYNRWRYLLIEQPQGNLSALQPLAILEIAHLIIDIMKNEVSTNHGSHFIDYRIRNRIYRIVFAEIFKDQYPELFAVWYNNTSQNLNRFVSFLRGEYRPSKPEIEMLMRSQMRLDQLSANPKNFELRQFMLKARDKDRTFKWDDAQCMFISHRY